MKNLEKSVQEIITLGYEKALRKGRRNVVVFIPLPYLPPVRPYKAQVVEVRLGEETYKVRLFTEASKEGGWVVRINFPREILSFNPVLPKGEGQKLLEKLMQK
jgi:hypothetical protein